MLTLPQLKSNLDIGGFRLEYEAGRLTIRVGLIKCFRFFLGALLVIACGLLCIYGFVCLAKIDATDHGTDIWWRVSATVFLALLGGLISIIATVYSLRYLVQLLKQYRSPVVLDKNSQLVLRHDEVLCAFDDVSKIRIRIVSPSEGPNENTISLLLRNRDAEEIVLYDSRYGISWKHVQAISREISKFIGKIVEQNDI